jgi:hypothetical protein
MQIQQAMHRSEMNAIDFGCQAFQQLSTTYDEDFPLGVAN